MKMSKASTSDDVIEKVKEEIDVREPNKFKVILHNDDKTTFDFVTKILMMIFHRSIDEAKEITAMIHVTGHGIAGVYSKEIAEEKTMEATRVARASGFPLSLSYEEV
jgi:ATP-dependent Clp protease adaptor protein ClpS